METFGIMVVVFTVLVPISSGCTTLQNVYESKDQGTSGIYPLTVDQAREITRAILQYEDATAVIHEPHGSEFMYARISNWLGDAGNKDWVGVWFDSLGEDITRVTVVSKRHFGLALPIALREKTFHKMFDQAVPVVVEGRPIPVDMWFWRDGSNDSD